MQLVKRLRYWIIAAFVVIVGGLFAVALMQTVRADHFAVAGKGALAAAETDIDAQHVHAARADLLAALGDFQQMHHHLSNMGPIAPIARITPFVRIQIRGATNFSEAGELLSTAGLQLVDAASAVLDPTDTHLRLSDALAELRTIRTAFEQRDRRPRRRRRQDPRPRRISADRPAQQCPRRPERPPAPRRAAGRVGP